MYRQNRRRVDLKGSFTTSHDNSLSDKAQEEWSPSTSDANLVLGVPPSIGSTSGVGTSFFISSESEMKSKQDCHSRTEVRIHSKSSGVKNSTREQATAKIENDNDVIFVGQFDSRNLSGPIDFCQAIAPRNKELVSGSVRGKRIHMESQQCQGHLETTEGNAPLTNPVAVAKSSRDPNRGMYPRSTIGKPPLLLSQYDAPKGFVKASCLGVELPSSHRNKMESERSNVSFDLSSKQDYSNPVYQSNVKFDKDQRGTKRKKLPQQGNTLKNYFNSPSQHAKIKASADIVDIVCVENPVMTSQSLLHENISSSTDIQEVPIPGESRSMKTTLAWTVTTPDLPQLYPGAPQSKVLPTSKLKASGSKRRRIAVTKQTDVSLMGPSIHSLRKASFLYDKELAKPLKSSSGDQYGLLGSGNVPSDASATTSYFERLPYEIIENIFCRLPMMDLLLNVNMVCKSWRDIISDDAFLPWKKRYHRVKVEMEDDITEMSQLLKEHGMVSKENFLMQLIRCMKTFKKVTSPCMDAHLQKHPKYECARALLEERVMDCLGADQTPNPWCTMTLLVILSEYVKDVQEIYQVLLGSSSEATTYEVVECLYCISTFLLMFKRQLPSASWNGMHYRLYYALYLYENESVTTADQLQKATSHGKTGQQSLHKYSANTAVQMTHEQLRICSHNVSNGDIVRIIAFAGTGKTTTLVKYTRLRPNLKFLLVVYNKSVKIHAQSKFPSNVTCKTGHGLAFGQEGRKFAEKKKLASSGLKVYNILKHCKAIKGESMYVQGKFIIDTLNRFMASADPFITTAHVPASRIDDDGKTKAIDHSIRMHLAAEAEKYWNKMVNLEDSALVTHDTYLKTYQLRKPKIWGYDIILIDEAQDMTPALADILLTQRHAKILVGDPHQQIYSFRGAVNAMQQVRATHTFYLTQSFRFGSEIAFVASSCLEILKREKKKTLVGNISTGSIRGDVSGQMAIITRSNFTLFTQAVAKCCYSDCPEKVAFVGGTDSFGFDTILDVYVLMTRFEPQGSPNNFQREIRNPFIAGFPNIAELEKYATKTMDGELLGKIKIVKCFTHALPSLISKIKAKCINDIDMADVVLSTAHKSKGLEFNSVKLTDDFLVEMHGSGPNIVNDDESNILYVAVTRAKKHLLLTPDLMVLLSRAGENFLYPVSSKELKAKEKRFVCVETDAEFKPCAATLVKRAVNIPNRPEKEDALISPAVVAMEMLPLRQLYGIYPPNEDSEKREQQANVMGYFQDDFN